MGYLEGRYKYFFFLLLWENIYKNGSPNSVAHQGPSVEGRVTSSAHVGRRGQVIWLGRRLLIFDVEVAYNLYIFIPVS